MYRVCDYVNSYQLNIRSKEVKQRAIALRDSGLSVSEIAKIFDTAKSNVEKWCSIKVSVCASVAMSDFSCVLA